MVGTTFFQPWLIAKMVTLAGGNHVLKPMASDGRGANVATYGNPAVAIDPAVPDTIATMILAGTLR